uniref:Uncharacterized protein n=1 Tax=Oryza brachyantha TaxID=4533 RepID=J3L0P5_ORYBR
QKHKYIAHPSLVSHISLGQFHLLQHLFRFKVTSSDDSENSTGKVIHSLYEST